MMDKARSFGEVVRRRSDADDGRPMLRFLANGERESEAWSYAELDRRARAIAARLQASCDAGDRALLLYPPGLEYVAALIGCFYAGVIAVPAYPPDPARLGRTLPRLRAIIGDAQATVALTSAAVHQLFAALPWQSEALGSLLWVVSDEVPGGAAEDAYRDPNLGRDAVALLQYTSGSTGTPRGVVIRHGNLLSNSAFIHRGFEHSRESHSVSWLPPYHDMGLVGGILQALYGGFPTTLMSPISFLERPIRWLQAISTYRANASGGPNFAYELCVRRVKPQDLANLDLTCWSIAFCGAEPIRPRALQAFGAAFATAGFAPAALYPCYGLAEATLAVTLSDKGKGFKTCAVDAHALERHVVLERAPADLGEDSEKAAVSLVGCGRAGAEHEIAIVDPETCERCEPDRVGEVWVRGASIAREYWCRPAESAAAFDARLADGSGPYLRTGDLGFLRGEELFVTGRLKDLLIVQGRNFYPHEIEAIAEASHPALRRNCCAVFPVEGEGSGQLVVVCEVDPAAATSWDDVAWAIRGQVGRQVDARVHGVVLIAPRSLRKTSSGKVQRWACRPSSSAASCLSSIAGAPTGSSGSQSPGMCVPEF
ncbi:MAG TPA: fatty acyl-AMP ligase [Polyangiaceae bacterium]